MEWLFVYDGGWWLKITDVKQLTEYHKRTDGKRYEGALMMYKDGKRPENMSLEERIRASMEGNRSFMLMQAAIIQAQNMEGTFLDGIRGLNMEAGMKELKDIREYGAVYINPVGGSTFSVDYTQFCRRKELIFPDFRKEDIRVKQFRGGSHWYAYIGDMQVRNGEELKWNTQEAPGAPLLGDRCEKAEKTGDKCKGYRMAGGSLFFACTVCEKQEGSARE